MPGHMLVFAFATLFVVIDPVGQVPIFIALTPGRRSAERRAVARRGVLVAAAVLVAFAWGGEPLLRRSASACRRSASPAASSRSGIPPRQPRGGFR